MGGQRSAKIGEIVEKIKEQGLTYSEGAKLYGIKVRAIYDYTRRQRMRAKKEKSSFLPEESSVETSNQEECQFSVEVKDKVSEVVPSLPEGVQELIVAYRKNNPDHGYRRIESYLKSKYFVVISRKKIREVLKLHGLEKTLDSSFDRKDVEKAPKGTRRFEAPFPRDLYQMDITYVYLTGIPVLYLAVIVDDYSRFCVAAELHDNQQGFTMIEVLHRAIERYGKPRKLLTDQGTSFYTWSNEQTIFQKYLDDMKIEHIVSDPHSPQTLGKTERLHQTIQRELLKKRRFKGYEDAKQGIEEYVHSYNYNRPHQGINGKNPCDRFYGIIGETSRIEQSFSSKSLDFSKGYLIFKNQEHTISVVSSNAGFQVFLDGNLLRGLSDVKN